MITVLRIRSVILELLKSTPSGTLVERKFFSFILSEFLQEKKEEEKNIKNKDVCRETSTPSVLKKILEKEPLYFQHEDPATNANPVYR